MGWGAVICPQGEFMMESNGRRPRSPGHARAGQESSANCSESWHAQCNNWFRKFAHFTAEAMGSAYSFFVAITLIVGWAVTGPMFHFSDTWQLVINTATTVVTFLMVFLIQNTQNRDAKAIHLKLDELIHAARHARNSLINLEELTDEDLDHLQKEFERVRRRANGESARRQPKE
jgi:low affinity Fe/Cu permease